MNTYDSRYHMRVRVVIYTYHEAGNPKKGTTMIKDAIFVSVWDDEIEIESSCKVNTDTKEVFDIESVNVDDYDIDICTGEYITMNDGSEFDVYGADDCSINDHDDVFWYDN